MPDLPPYDIYGPAVTPWQMERWIRAGLAAWLPSYIAQAKAADGYTHTVKPPASWEVAPNVRKWPAQALPAVIVEYGGTTEDGFQRQGDGSYNGTHVLVVAVVLRGRDEMDKRQLASIYLTALTLLLLQQAGDFAAAGAGYVDPVTGEAGPAIEVIGVEPVLAVPDEVPQEGARTLAAPTVTFTVEVANLASAAYGPLTPPADPLDPGEWPEILTTELTTTKVDEIE